MSSMGFSLERKKTVQISVGRVLVGGGAPVSVQSMTNTPTEDAAATVAQIEALSAAGCEIVRVAVPDMEAAHALADIKGAIDIPLIADIHFDHRLAVAAAKSGVDGLRINPGNIGNAEKVRTVARCADDHGIPIRIGVNGGSLDKKIMERFGGATPLAMVESAMMNIDMLASCDFDRIKVSIKASDVARTVGAYRLLSSRTDFPLHVGVTEAGSLYPGIVKSSLGIGMLLAEGIGDTIRVSLTRDPVEEVRVGYEILKALDIRRYGPELISCPTCGRCRIDLFSVVEEVEKVLMEKKIDIKVAIMGCVVNGPGEAKEADIGIAGGDGTGILFKKGKVVRKIPQENLVAELLDEIEKHAG